MRDLASDGDSPWRTLTELVERCLLADLPETLPELMRHAAPIGPRRPRRGAPDGGPAAAGAAQRYGDVRGTDTSVLGEAVDGLVVRIWVGLPPATGGLDDDGAAALVQDIADVDAALRLVAHSQDADASAREGWLDTLASIAGRDTCTDCWPDAWSGCCATPNASSPRR